MRLFPEPGLRCLGPLFVAWAVCMILCFPLSLGVHSRRCAVHAALRLFHEATQQVCARPWGAGEHAVLARNVTCLGLAFFSFRVHVVERCWFI
jgi:hypothetical protein